MKASRDGANSTRSGSAFTLIELLVAAAIMGVVCLLLLKLVSDTQGAAGSSLRRLDADSQGQLALDRIFLDVSAAQIRNDLPGMVTNAVNGEPSLAFFTHVRSAGGSRGLSLVSYRLARDTDSGSLVRTGRLGLQRAAKGVDWSEADFMGRKADDTTLGMPDLPANLQMQDSDYDVLADGVIRLAVCWQKSDGTMQVDPPPGPSLDFSQIKTLVVTLVIIDGRSLKLLNPAQVDAIASAFPAPVAGATPAAAWSDIARNAGNFPQMPKEAVKSLRVYQRFFSLQQSTRL